MPGKLLNANEVQSFLDAHFGEEVSAVTLLGEGDWSKAFAFQRDDSDFVVRFGAYGEDFEKDRHAVTFAGPYLPIPLVTEIGRAFDGAFAISERRHGLFLEQIDLSSFQHLTPNLLRLFDALREVPVNQEASADWPAKANHHLTWRDWLATSVEDDDNPRVGGWRGELAKDADIESLYVRGVRSLNDRLVDCPNALHVVHGDLLNKNVLVSFDAKRVEAVFDWGCFVFGDFLYDVAWFTFWAPWFPALEALNFRDVFRAHAKEIGLDVPSFDDRLTCYEVQIGLNHLAYNTVMKDPVERARVAKRTEAVLTRQL